MTSPVLRLGSNVLYTLTAADCDAIDAQYPPGPGFAPPTRSEVAAGEVLPAVVTKLGATTQNLKVLLDGAAAYWAQNVGEGTGLGTWAWPA
jgi:hypothetical protein